MFKLFKKPKWPNWSLERDKKTPVIYKKNKSPSREIRYSFSLKELISKNKGVLDFFKKNINHLENLKSKSSVTKTVVLGNGALLKLSLEKLSRERNAHISDSYYLFKINVNGSEKKFFVKQYLEKNGLRGINSINEFRAINIISNLGFNVISTHFAYSDKISKKSVIFYEFQDRLITFEKALDLKLLGKSDFKTIKEKLVVLDKTVNKFLKDYSFKYGDYKVIDILPPKGKSKYALPVFIDFQTKKLYVFDPLMVLKDFKF